MKKIGIIGAGAWGTALAMAANRAACEVMLWDRNARLITDIKNTRYNSHYLPNVYIDPTITVTDSLNMVCSAEIIILAIPAQYVRSTCIAVSNFLNEEIPIIAASKGIEIGSLLLMSQVVASVLPYNPVAVLSGPNFAAEVAATLPAATTIACDDEELGKQLIFTLGTTMFRPYYVNDIIGAQVGGAMKNVIAIACGITAGRSLGENARAAIITRGMAEIRKVCAYMGGRQETLLGLSGLGDLVLTCMSEKSRNLSFGIALGKGKTVDYLMEKHQDTIEGVATAKALYELAEKAKLDLPICQSICAILHQGAPLDETIQSILSRQFTTE